MMDFGYRLYPTYNGYTGVDRKGINTMIDQLIAKHDELPALSIEMRLLFFHRGIGGVLAVNQKYSRITKTAFRDVKPTVYDGVCRDIA